VSSSVRVPLPALATATAAAVHEALVAAAAVRHPRLAAPVRLTEDGTLEVPLPGQPLDAGPAPATGSVARLVPVAHALVAIHAAGIAHGDVAGMLRVDPTRGLVLAGLGVAQARHLADPERVATPTPAEDVRALAGIARTMLLGAGQDARAAQLTRFLDPAAPRDARTLATTLHELVSAGRGVVARPVPRHAAAPRIRRAQVGAAVLVVAVVGLAGVVAVLLGARGTGDGLGPAAGSSPRPAVPSSASALAAPPPEITPPEITPPEIAAPEIAPADATPAALTSSAASDARVGWVRIVRQLFARRVSAFMAGDGDGLRAVYAAGAPGWREDRALLARHRRVRVAPAGLAHQVRAARPVVPPTAGAVTLAVTDRIPPYRLVRADGGASLAVPSTGWTTWRVELVRSAAGWRLAGGAVVAGRSSTSRGVSR
jgi:hypothetical protein